MELVFIGYNHVHDSDLNINRPLGSGDFLVLLVKSPAIFTINGKDVHTPPNIFLCIQKMHPNITVPTMRHSVMTGCIWSFPKKRKST